MHLVRSITALGQNIYMLPSDMNLKIKTGTVGYNNKILVSNEKFSLGKNDEVNETPKISHEPTITQAQKPNITHVLTQAQKLTHTDQLAKKPTHGDERIALILFLTGGFTLSQALHGLAPKCKLINMHELINKFTNDYVTLLPCENGGNVNNKG